MGDIVAVCSVYYVTPFPVLLLFFKREFVHSVGEVKVCSHFMLKRVIEEELDVGVFEVGLWKLLMLRHVGLLVSESSRKWI